MVLHIKKCQYKGNSCYKHPYKWTPDKQLPGNEQPLSSFLLRQDYQTFYNTKLPPLSSTHTPTSNLYSTFVNCVWFTVRWCLIYIVFYAEEWKFHLNVENWNRKYLVNSRESYRFNLIHNILWALCSLQLLNILLCIHIFNPKYLTPCFFYTDCSN